MFRPWVDRQCGAVSFEAAAGLGAGAREGALAPSGKSTVRVCSATWAVTMVWA
jgi:hypothetical protein